MSTESPAGSRPPQTNSANESETGASTAETDVSDSGLSDLPTPSEKVGEFLDEMGDLAHRPVSERHGMQLRAECVEVERERYTVTTEESGEVEEERVVSETAVPLWKAVAEMLEWQEEYHRSALRLEYGRERDPTHEILTVDLDNSWMAAYQEQERARLKALERETCGYQLCEDGECGTRWCQEPEEHSTRYVGGEFEEPVVVLTGRTASGRGMAPADHAREIAETFSYEGVRRSLRYVMDKLGLESGEWVRWTQGEPHTSKRAGEGYGTNTGYHHTHDIIILDEAAVSGEVSAGDFREVIETHVAECEGAGGEAHDLDVADWDEAPATAECVCESGCEECVGTVTVKKVEDEIEESVASYAAAYLVNESVDLLERSPEYLAWAATMWATETQKATGTDSRTHAIKADGCKYKYHAADEDQELAHGEEVDQDRVRGNRRIVCMACGSPWGIDQDQTLASARTGGEAAAADGGREYGPPTLEEHREEELRDTDGEGTGWKHARSAAVVGGEVSERAVAGRGEGRELEGRVLRLGGGEDYCPACGEVDPTGECPATDYREAEYEGFCPLPPEHFGEHTIVEGESDADNILSTGSEQYRGDGHVPFEYEEEPDSGGEVFSAGFERPPRWRAKAVIRDGEEFPASGGGTDTRTLKLRDAPEVVASMAVRGPGVTKCMECGTTFDTPRAYAEHGCDDGEVGVGWLAPTDPPAEESRVSRERFLAAVPDRYLDGEVSRAGGEEESCEAAGEESVAAELERVEELARTGEVSSVIEAMGRVGLPPEVREKVENMIDSR